MLQCTQDIKRCGFRDYEATLEGELSHHCVGSVPHDIDRSQVRFMQVGGLKFSIPYTARAPNCSDILVL